MKNQNEIFDLLDNLSQNEKRYFKIFVSRHLIRGSSHYIHLMDGLIRLKDSQRKDLKAHLPKYLKRNLNEHKYLLQNQILKSLHAYYQESDFESRLNYKLRQAHILFNKMLYRQADRQIQKVKELAMHTDAFNTMVEALNLERNIAVYHLTYDSLITRLEKIIEEKESVMIKMNELNELLRLRDLIYIFYLKIGIIRNKVQRNKLMHIIKNPLLKKNPKLHSAIAEYYFHYINSVKGFLLQDSMIQHDASIKMMQIFEKKPMYKKAFPVRHVHIIQSILNALSEKERKEESLHFTGVLKKYFYETTGMHAAIIKNISFYALFYYEMDYYLYCGDEKMLKKILNEMEVQYPAHEEKLLADSKLTLITLSATCYFALCNYKKSIQWCRKIIDDVNHETRQDLQTLARIIMLLCHFELHNYDLLPYIIRSVYRYIYKRGRMFKMENIFFRYLKKLSNVANNRQLKAMFLEMKTEMEELRQVEYEKTALEYFDIISYLEAKLRGRRFIDVLKAKSEQ